MLRGMKQSIDDYFITDEATTSKEMFGRLYRDFIKPWRSTLIIAVILMVIAAATAAANAWLIQPALDEIFGNKNMTMLKLIPIAIILVAIVSAFSTYGQNVLMRKVGQAIIARMQVKMFDHMVRSDLAMFHDQSSGRLISRFTNDIAMMQTTVSTLLTTIAKEALSAVFLIGVMVYQSWQLSMIALLIFPIAIFPVMKLGKRMRKVATSTQQEMGHFTSQLDEVFGVVRVVKAYGREDVEVARAKKTVHGLYKLMMKAVKIQAIASPMMEMLGSLAIAGVIYYGGLQVIDGTTTPGAFFSFIAAMMLAYKPLRAMAGVNTQFQVGMAAARRFYAVMDTKPAIKEKPDAALLNITKSDVNMRDVNFSYADGTTAIEGLNLHIPAGKMVALVGASGAGKSTIMNLMMRFYDVSDGAITIDGQDIRDVTFASLRHNMALVSQEVMLFDDSVFANIAYGMENATKETVEKAARDAAAHDFIMALPNGYDSMIGPSGAKLSGGQRQRLSIARAMLKNAPILLLDEATSALDTESERHVQAALDGLMDGRTSLVIAHRLSTILHADLIYVLDGGRVIESGSHKDLLASGGAYAGLHAAQFSKIDAA